MTGWRQSANNIRRLKKLYREAQQLKRSKARNAKRVDQKQRRILAAHKAYVDAAEWYLEKVAATLELMVSGNLLTTISHIMIEHYMEHAKRQIDQIRRRVLNGETIPHSEKVFSIFEEHTEWISKGKAGVPQELGLRVCIVEDQHGFYLNHLVMKKTTDEKVAIALIEETKKIYPQLSSCSFDKGFYSPRNKEALEKILDFVVLPKKGKLTAEERDIEKSEEFVSERRKHSMVESGISALENHGLDRCFDHGIRGFERYTALAITARNIQTLGTVLWKKKIKQLERAGPLKRKAS